MKSRLELMETFQDALNNMNFHKIKLAMQAVDWHWASVGRVPTIQEMQDEVERLFASAMIRKISNERILFASGGFEVEISERDDVFIRFVMEEAESIDP